MGERERERERERGVCGWVRERESIMKKMEMEVPTLLLKALNITCIIEHT